MRCRRPSEIAGAGGGDVSVPTSLIHPTSPVWSLLFCGYVPRPVLRSHNSGVPFHRIVVCGAGSAGMGVVHWLCKAMEKHGAPADEAASEKKKKRTHPLACAQHGLVISAVFVCLRVIIVCVLASSCPENRCSALNDKEGRRAKLVSLGNSAFPGPPKGNFWILDADGLITDARSTSVEEATRRFARPMGGEELADGSNVEQVLRLLSELRLKLKLKPCWGVLHA